MSGARFPHRQQQITTPPGPRAHNHIGGCRKDREDEGWGIKAVAVAHGGFCVIFSAQLTYATTLVQGE